jgi:hypothetical protein
VSADTNTPVEVQTNRFHHSTLRELHHELHCTQSTQLFEQQQMTICANEIESYELKKKLVAVFYFFFFHKNYNLLIRRKKSYTI